MTEDNQSEVQNLKKEIVQIRADYEKAKKILDNIQSFSDEFIRLSNTLKNENDGVDATFNLIKNKKDEISNWREQSQGYLNELVNNLEKVKANIQSMQVSYNEFSELKGKISGKNQEIENLSKTVNGLKDDIERTKQESQAILDNIKKIFEEVQNKVSTMNAAYQEFLVIKGKIDDSNTGLQKVYDTVQSLQTKAQTLVSEIQSFRDESSKILDNIKKDQKEILDLKAQIVELLEGSALDRDQVRSITDLITDTGFANAFQKRAKNLFRTYVIWGVIFIAGVIALTIVLILLLGGRSTGDVPELNIIAYRLSLTSPLIFLVLFAMKQYSKERGNNEKYEFKAVTATVIRNHVDYLLKTTGSVKEIKDFILNVFTKIYDEPYHEENDDRLKLFEDELKELKKNKITGEKFDVKEIVSSVKELKSLIADESLLEKIVGILFKK